METVEAKKNAIPKLADNDRQEVLPFIIKILLSKLLKKRGKINQKNFGQRLNIVYTFLSGLNNESEYPLIFGELLEPLNLGNDRRDGLLDCSFGQFIQFISYVEVVFKQMGALLVSGDYLK